MVTFDGYDVELSRGDTLAIKIDLSGRDLPEGTDGVFTIKKRIKDDEVVLQKRFDASDEMITVVLDADETNIEPGTYYWDVRLQIPVEDGGYEVYTPMEYAAFVVLPVVGVDIGVDGSNLINPDLPVLQVILADSKRALSEMQDALGSIESLKTLVNDAEDSVAAANAAADRANHAAQGWEDGTAANAEKLGGIPAENYLQKTETAADSSKLGGKAPEYYLSPQNLLDNSDFRNPVNQRGATNYAGYWVYGIDRWMVVTDNELSEGNGVWVDDGYINLYYYGELLQKISLERLKGKTFTFAVCNSEGVYTTNVVVPENPGTGDEYYGSLWEDGSVVLEAIKWAAEDTLALRIRNTYYGWRAFYWAALYEGTYTAETLPPYVPKGYAAELAECQRYFLRLGSTTYQTIGSGQANKTTSIVGVIPLAFEMRVIEPSISYSGTVCCRSGGVYIEATSVGLNSGGKNCISIWLDNENGLAEVGKAYDIFLLPDSYLTISADL